MEQYKFERVNKICEDLSGLCTVQSVPVTEWKYKKGLFLRPDEADKNGEAWTKFDCDNDIWPGPDEHYWFNTTITVPESFDNKPLWLSFITQCTFWDAVNPQFLLFINGEVTQGLDINHREVKITDHAKAGEVYTIDLQAYTGRDNDQNKGTTSYLRLMANMIEIDPYVTECYYNLLIPNQIVSHLDKNDLSRINLQNALEKAINLLDLREPFSTEFYDSVKKCNDFVKVEIYEKLAGSDEVIATCIGHTHIDVAWWWTVAQTKEKVVRSFSTVLKLMEEYPDYKFMSSQPQLYKFLKLRYPELFEKIKERVKEGRWETEGGMWLEADCNVTSGESLVRQFLHGKKFFKDEFNQDNKILWLPDVFGYSAALPQILVKSGIKYFMTTKIAWNQFNKLPMDTFWWKGIDGSEIFTHLITTQDVEQPADSFYTTYNGKLDPVCLMRGWERYQQKDVNNDILISYGWGDGGGGPTRRMLETGVRMEKGIKGSPKVRMESSRKYFDELYKRVEDKKLPKWVGELYLEYHRGTYTTMARNKRSNRKCELLWQDVEFFSVLAETLGVEYNAQEIYDAWEVILLNQFHDILPGSSIAEVYEVTKEEYAELEKRGNEIINEKLNAIAKKLSASNGDLAVFNSLSAERDNDVVKVASKLYDNVKSFTDADSISYPVQYLSNDKLVFSPKNIPSKGIRVFTPSNDVVESENTVKIDGNRIETPFYTITLDEIGQFNSVYDKENRREVLKKGGKGNVLRVYEDKPIYYDNWDIEIYYKQKSWVVDNLESMTWIDNGPVLATLEIKRKFLHSTIIQKITFYKNNRRVDFDTYVDWKQHQLLLKTEFDVDINASEATYDIQFGELKRPTHENTSWDAAKFEVCGHKWGDISEGDYGFALLNDCKYGYGITDGKVTLSLVKSGILPNPNTDVEEHFFTYSMLPHAKNVDESNVKAEAYCLNVPVRAIKVENPEADILPGSFVSVDSDNVIIETVKKALDGNGIIIRMYENANRRTNATISFNKGNIDVVECNLIEEPLDAQTVTVDDSESSFTIKPFEIKTFRITNK